MTTDDERIKMAIKLAREKYTLGSNDDIEIDDKPETSVGDLGVFVSAWLWVPWSDVEEMLGPDDEEEEDDHE